MSCTLCTYGTTSKSLQSTLYVDSTRSAGESLQSRLQSRHCSLFSIYTANDSSLSNVDSTRSAGQSLQNRHYSLSNLDTAQDVCLSNVHSTRSAGKSLHCRHYSRTTVDTAQDPSWSKETPPWGVSGFFYLLPWSRTRIKRTPLEAPGTCFDQSVSNLDFQCRHCTRYVSL